MNRSYSPLAWYDSIEEQNHNKWYAFGNVYRMCMPNGYILPFQFNRPASDEEIAYVMIHPLSGGNPIDITNVMLQNGLEVVSDYNAYGYDVIRYNSNNSIGVTVDDGYYYLSIEYGSGIIFSEVFTFSSDLSKHIRIEWEIYDDIVSGSGIVLSGNNVLYVSSDIGKPEYIFEEEGTDRDGLFFAEKQLSEKVYRFTFLAPEYVCDSIRLAQMADSVIVTDANGNSHYCDTFNTTVEWQEQGDVASVEVKFTTSAVLKKVGKGLSSSKNAPKYLTFTAAEDNSSVAADKRISATYDWEFSSDGVHWNKYSGSVISLPNKGSKVMFRGAGCKNTSGYAIFSLRGKINASGSVMSLIDKKGITTGGLVENAFSKMFYNQTALLTPPDITALSLPKNCCIQMFAYCSNLTRAANLDALSVGEQSCLDMYLECESLTYAPDLKVIEFKQYYGCSGMFAGCSSLTKAPALPATNLGSHCYYNMFISCSSLVEAPELPATTLAASCYQGMFALCTSLKKTPEFPATTLNGSCYQSMFQDCTALEEASDIIATELSIQSCRAMFSGCKSLKKAPSLSQITSVANYCCHSMFNGCASLEEASVPSAITLYSSCYNSMFENCQSLKKAPALPATTLASSCYQWMFRNCASLEEATELPATTLADYCYAEMFRRCVSLEEAPELPATTLTEQCYAQMFANCTSLVDAPELPATTLAYRCYYNMFGSCVNLSEVVVRAREWNTDWANDWLDNVAPTGRVYRYAEANIPTQNNSGIPTNWGAIDLTD